jgi:hypothetical protein
MPQPLQVVTDDLAVSAATVDTHADRMRATHAAADEQIEGACSGVPAGGAVALGAALSKWQADTSALYGQLVGHGHGLRSGAQAYTSVDGSAATEIDTAGQRMPVPDLGL